MSSIHDFLLVTSAAEEGELDRIDDVIQEMGRNAARRLQLLAKRLAESAVTAEFRHVMDEPELVTLSPPSARLLADWLSEYEERLTEFEVVGVLRVLDTVRNRFGIEDIAGTIYEGKAPRVLLTGANVEGRTYRARIQRETRTAEHTGTTSDRLSLLSLTPVDEP